MTGIFLIPYTNLKQMQIIPNLIFQLIQTLNHDGTMYLHLIWIQIYQMTSKRESMITVTEDVAMHLQQGGQNNRFISLGTSVTPFLHVFGSAKHFGLDARSYSILVQLIPQRSATHEYNGSQQNEGNGTEFTVSSKKKKKSK